MEVVVRLVVFNLEAATYVLPPGRIAAALTSLAHSRGAREERPIPVSAEEDLSTNREVKP